MKKYNYDNLTNEFYQKIEFENITSVNEIILDIKNRGNNALKEYSQKFDNISKDSFLISDEEIAKAIESTDKSVIDSIKFAADNIR